MPRSLDNLRAPIVIAITVALLAFFASWSGIPRQSVETFWLGVAIMIGILGAFGFALWHLLIRPLPAGLSTPQTPPIAANLRRALAILLGISGMSVVVGIFWDEVWHRQYGTPFGEDFFWRPHLLMYFGFIVVIVLAFAGLYLEVWKGKGTFQQRFRADPIIGLLILAGGYLMVMLPADPIWHSIYGEDLTAWGIPHLTLIASFIMMCLLSIAIHMTTVPVGEWRGWLRLQSTDLLPLFNTAVCFLAALQFFAVEWDAGWSPTGRPEWLLPSLIGGTAALFGIMINHALRMPRAATFSGLLALLLRYLLIRLFGVEDMMFINAWLLALLPLIAIDLYSIWTLRSGRELAAWGTGTAAALGMGIALLTLYPPIYIRFPVRNLPVALIAIWLACLGAGWAGTHLGDYFAACGKQIEPAAQTAQSSSTVFVSLAIFAVCALFVVFFVTTAAPPV